MVKHNSVFISVELEQKQPKIMEMNFNNSPKVYPFGSSLSTPQTPSRYVPSLHTTAKYGVFAPGYSGVEYGVQQKIHPRYENGAYLIQLSNCKNIVLNPHPEGMYAQLQDSYKEKAITMNRYEFEVLLEHKDEMVKMIQELDPEGIAECDCMATPDSYTPQDQKHQLQHELACELITVQRTGG